jgi:hypothetical protein
VQREEESVEVGAVDDRQPHVQEKQAKVAMILKDKKSSASLLLFKLELLFHICKTYSQRKTLSVAVKIC